LTHRIGYKSDAVHAIFRQCLFYAVHRCGLYATDVARSVVCVYVLGRRVNCAKRLNRSRCRTSRVDPRNHVLDGRPDPHGKGHYSFRGHMCMPAHRWPTVTYLYTMTSGALRIVRLECAYSANAADECMTRDKTAMRPFAKLLWILVNCRES